MPRLDTSSPNRVLLLKLLLPAAMPNTVAFSGVHSMGTLKDEEGMPETITINIPTHCSMAEEGGGTHAPHPADGPESQHQVYVNGVHRCNRHPQQHRGKGQAKVLQSVDYSHCHALVTSAAPATVNGADNCQRRRWRFAPLCRRRRAE
jgi:hypothetical protein